MRELLPEVEHRWCARHIYANWSKKYSGAVYCQKFWACSRSTFEERFRDTLDSLGETDPRAAEIVLTYPPAAWVRAYFSTRSKCWMPDNNLCESFNFWIGELRYLPIISMVDGIRTKLMHKWAESETKAGRWKGVFSPACQLMFDDNRMLSMDCGVEWNGEDGYEVTEGTDKHVVFLERKSCSCRIWDLTGIPCQHAMSALHHAKIDPTTQIHRFYHKETYLAGYRTKFQPIKGEAFWQLAKFKPLEPAPEIKLPGRPNKKGTDLPTWRGTGKLNNLAYVMLPMSRQMIPPSLSQECQESIAL